MLFFSSMISDVSWSLISMNFAILTKVSSFTRMIELGVTRAMRGHSNRAYCCSNDVFDLSFEDFLLFEGNWTCLFVPAVQGRWPAKRTCG